MALQHCTACTTAYALGLESCPHCRQPAKVSVSLPADIFEPEPKRRTRKAEPPPAEETTGD